MSLGSKEKLLQDMINTCCSVRNDLNEMFCTRSPEELSSIAVYEKVDKNCILLRRCKDYLAQSEVKSDFPDTHLLCVQNTLCSILLTSALTLCETYVNATDKFRDNRDRVGYKRALFTHQGKLHHADLDYHCACHHKATGEAAVLTSTFLDRCAAAVCHAYNIHSYVDGSSHGMEGPNLIPLSDLIHRMIQSTSVLYTPTTLPPDLVESTKRATNCRQCSRDAVIRGTMALSGTETLCTCTTSMYSGTNTDGGKHNPFVSARHTLFDTTQRSMCMQSPLCECTVHKDTFKQTLTQFVTALTGKPH